MAKKSDNNQDTTKRLEGRRVGRRNAATLTREHLPFEGVREIDEAERPKYRPLPLGMESDEHIDLNAITPVARISLASPELILKWSQRHSAAGRKARLVAPTLYDDSPLDLEAASIGEVKKPETINYRTFKPERDGLFCERIFGPQKDWECACGKYRKIKYKGIVCDRCGVEVIESKVRRTRMGHIKLAAPVCHIWFYRGNRIAPLLDIPQKALERIVYYQDFIVVDPGDTSLKVGDILTADEAREFMKKYGDKVKIKTGGEAVRDLLARIDIDQLARELAIEMRNPHSLQRRAKIVKRLKVVEAFRGSGNRPEWMVLEVLPVIPPELRPLVHLDGGRFASSDLNDLYRRVISRNNRLKKLMELQAPDVILRNEKRMLQEAVDALLDNAKRSRPTKGHNNRQLKSLSDLLRGKQGRFRQNLLGKRVDYSGRSVIVVGPELKFNECGLPKKMAIELFEPFIIGEIQRRGLASNIKAAKRLIQSEAPEVYDILDDIIKDHPVLLNRAPTLHRLGIQAFMPKLIEGKAIQLHPLACGAFNADFDGDQMAVHVPLSVEAILEAKRLMMAENNILLPASGKPVAIPSQDIVLGLFYLTKMVPNEERYADVTDEKEKEKLMPRFASKNECIMALNHKQVELHEEIFVRLPDGRRVKTTPGRVLFSEILPPEIDFFDSKKNPSFANQVQTKKTLGQIAALAHKLVGKKRTAVMLDSMKDMGFYFAKRAGLSISVKDLVIPPRKQEILARAHKRVDEIERQERAGKISPSERYNKVIHEWSLAAEEIGKELIKCLEKDQKGLNPVYMMAFSGARGNESQIRQLAGMRGLMQRPTKKITGGVGEIIDTPITSNFREGLSVLEYFISTHGSRKGLADTALKTSDAGYLTRRLVDVAQSLIITEEDCGTTDGIDVTAIKETSFTGEHDLVSLSERIIGRVAACDIIHPKTGEKLVSRNQEITEEIAKQIELAGIESVKIRSVLTCKTLRGICALCYGRNLATGRLVEPGEAVGVIAAQSIGEPGTQLTLRTFHVGGMASLTAEGWYQATKDGIIRFEELEYVVAQDNKRIVTSRNGAIVIQSHDGLTLQRLPNVPYGAILFVEEGQEVKSGQRICEWDPHHTPILAEASGTVRLVDVLPGITLREEVDEEKGTVIRSISEHREDLHPAIEIVGDDGTVLARQPLSVGSILDVNLIDGRKVQPGDVLARIPRLTVRSKDITGGLPRVEELFEARKPKDAAVISEIDGVVGVESTTRNLRRVPIRGDDGREIYYTIPGTRHLIVTSGQRVKAGEPLTDGTMSPHDILAIKGEKAVMEFLLSEVQEVYRAQNVTISDKHIEIIIRQMLKKVEIEKVGNTRFLYHQVVDKAEFEEENRLTKAKGGMPAEARPKLLSISKASTEGESFIAAASFQETVKVLTDAAIRGRYDYLRGLKENLIMGLLIPAGTGLPKYRNIEVRPKKDREEDTTPEAAEPAQV
jgi:DNA-directed RNA polymerase subunit beta'